VRIVNDMDAYVILEVSRVCTREEVKETFRSRVHSAHPDRGGDGEAFIQLCAAYHQILDELDRRADPIVEPPRDRVRPAQPDPGAARTTYVSWLRQVANVPARRRRPWWRKHPRIARAILLVLIALSGVLIVLVTWIFGPEVSPLTGLPRRR
jgi:curved DNA-binding protein CbpA